MSIRDNLWRDDLTRVELRPPLAVGVATSLADTIETMRRASTGCVLVCQDQQLRGIFTERDYIKGVLARRADLAAPVRDYMTPQPVTARRSDPIGSAIRTMYKGGYRHLPVVDDAGIPIGILSVKHIVQYLADHFPSAVYNLPPQPRQAQETREGA